MTADDMGQDIVNQVTKLVDYQSEVQKLVGKRKKVTTTATNFIFQYWYKYHMAWMTFTPTTAPTTKSSTMAVR